MDRAGGSTSSFTTHTKPTLPLLQTDDLAVPTGNNSSAAAQHSPEKRVGEDAMASPVLTGSQGKHPVSSPPVSKLPALHFAITQDRLRLPSSFSQRQPFDATKDSLSPLGTPLVLEKMKEHMADSVSGLKTLSSSQYLSGGSLAYEYPKSDQTATTTQVHQPQTSSNNGSILPMEDNANDVEMLKQRRKKGTRRGTLNPEAKSVLKAWMFSPEHFAHPYPSEEEKEELASEAGIEVKQLSNWFTNARKRLWQPVLRQSGVEVKNFLSTGRGGPRGNKLDVPVNLQHLVVPSPPSSPVRQEGITGEDTPSVGSPLKRTWSESNVSNSISDVVAKRKNLSRKRSKETRKDDMPASLADTSTITKIATQLSDELRRSLVEKAVVMRAASPQSVMVNPTTGSDSAPSFHDLEILAATSLIGLHQQVYQSVH